MTATGAKRAGPVRPGDRRTAIVVGGGASGVAAAWYLRDAGWQVTIVEAADRLGGRAASSLMGDREVTLGGKNIGHRYRRFREFIEAHGPAEYEPFGINSSRVTPRGLQTVDSSRRARSLLGLVRDIAPRDIVRLGTWARRVARNEDDRWADSPYFGRIGADRGDPTVAEVLGRRAVDTLVRPMTVRMNGAEPDEALISAFGSNLGTLLDTYDQLTGGFGPVLERFAATVDCRLSTRVVGTRPTDRRRAVIVEGGETLEADAVVLALPAASAAALVRDEAPGVARALDSVRYFPARVVVAEYDRPVFTPAVRAVVFGADSIVSNAGAYGIDDLGTIRYTFSGRRARGQLDREPDELLGAAEATLGRHMPVAAARRVRYATALWERAYCAFGRGHHALARELERPIAPGLHVCGDFVSGASMEACFRSAERTTGAVAAAPVAR